MLKKARIERKKIKEGKNRKQKRGAENRQDHKKGRLADTP